MITSEVLCRFSGDSTVKVITPEVFNINGTDYIRQQHKLAGVDYRSYYTILHNGRTKLLASLSSRVEGVYKNVSNRDIQGIYRTKTQYYIQKGEAQPEFIKLTKNSVLTVLYDQAEKISAKIPAKQLSPEDVISVLTYYDALVAADQGGKQPLSVDPVFTQVLHEKMTYPLLARYKVAYGRVYTGFEIDDQGVVKNITTLSPDNGGVGFVQTVKNALEKLPKLSPALSGKYALPVAFTYTNSMERAGPHVPVNRLSPDRLEGRILLEEVIVPVGVTKPVTDSREVWGYYK